MKNIKFFSLAALLMAGAAFTACSNDNDVADEKQQTVKEGTYTLTIQAGKNITRALAVGDSNSDGINDIIATWATTENVYVQKGSTWTEGSLQPQEAGTTTTLKGELSGITINANDELTLQFPKSGAISYAGQVGTLADIAANFDYATATVEVASVSATGNIIPKAATTTFTNQQAIVKFTLLDKGNSDAAISATQLVVNDGTNDYTINPASGTSEIYVAIPGISGQTVTLTATVGTDTYTYEKSGVTFTNGEYYEITVKMTQAPAPAGAINGKFTINNNGDQVQFSPGNLQYQASTDTWRFAENQWDYIGSANSNISQTNSGWIDLFGWGTWGEDGNPWNKYRDYDWDWEAYYQWSSDFQGTLDGHNDWRTLESGEWSYLLGTDFPCRNNAANLCKWRTVNEVYGLVIMPDGFDYSTTSLDSDWNVLETAGAVFLPAAGYRDGTSLSGVGVYGHYWSSTAVGYGFAGCLDFGEDGAIVNDYECCGGYSVRLVCPAE